MAVGLVRAPRKQVDQAFVDGGGVTLCRLDDRDAPDRTGMIHIADCGECTSIATSDTTALRGRSAIVKRLGRQRQETNEVKFRPIILTATAAVVFAACGSSGASKAPVSQVPSVAPAPSDAMSTAPSSAPSGSATTAAVMTDTAAADLRTKLDLALGEHIIFATKATDAALGGRAAEFAAYGDLLNKNGTDLGDMIGSVYGAGAKDAFNQIWSAHNGFFVDYTKGVAANDKAMQDKAVKNLTTVYVPQFSDLLAGATGLPKDAVTQLVTDHVLQTKAVVDAQAKKDWTAVYSGIRTAYAHMFKIGDALAAAIVKQNPAKIAGDASNKGVDLRVGLNELLQEHLYLASSATGAALGGRNDQFAAAGTALNTNGTDIGAAIGSVYGAAAKDQFNTIWSAHNGFFVDYTKGVAANDKAKMDKAVQDLTTVYLPQFADFLAGATGLPNDALSGLIKTHILTTKAIVDAQFAKDFTAAASADRAAGQHMEMIGDPLAKAIVAKVPDKFR